jgi:hypothetical protein
MSCNCIEDFTRLIRERSEDPEASVNIAFNISRDSGKLFARPKMSCQYRDKKKDGTFSKANDHPISGEYCPFCGKAYVEPAADTRKEGEP